MDDLALSKELLTLTPIKTRILTYQKISLFFHSGRKNPSVTPLNDKKPLRIEIFSRNLRSHGSLVMPNIIDIEMKLRYYKICRSQECFSETYMGNPGLDLWLFQS